MYPKREANRRKAADSGQIVGNSYITGIGEELPVIRQESGLERGFERYSR
jgi:hypothetical protein